MYSVFFTLVYQGSSGRGAAGTSTASTATTISVMADDATKAATAAPASDACCAALPLASMRAGTIATTVWLQATKCSRRSEVGAWLKFAQRGDFSVLCA